jgi:hypothetical protein
MGKNDPHLKGFRTTRQHMKNYDRQAKAMEMRRSGFTYSKIAALLGFSNPSSAARSVQALMRKTVRDDAQHVMIMELDRLEELWAAVYPLAMGFRSIKRKEPDPDNSKKTVEVEELIPLTPEDQAKAISKCIQIMERRSKFLGLDAPVKSDVFDKRAMEQFQQIVINEIAKAAPEIRDAILERLKAEGLFK